MLLWSRLMTSIFPSGAGSENGENENGNRTSEGDVTDPFLQQERLLLATVNQQQLAANPLYQQQLFFYADEVFGGHGRASTDSDNNFSQDDYSAQRRYSSEGSSDREDAPSFFQGAALAANASLQGELAQEDRRESMELMNSTEQPFVRPSTPSQLTGDGFTVPRPLSVDGRIPVSCLALSQPPSYWEAAVKYKGFPTIDPRPEQGQENLPRYTCSVFREGCVNRKTEIVGNWRPYRRPWKRTFAHLRGTALRLYAVDDEDVPRLHIRNISLQLALCELATDYKQRPNVIRIRACDRTILIECKDRVDALTWLEHLQAAANIATSLEERSMPKFFTLPRAQPHTATSAGQRSNASSTSSATSRRQSENDAGSSSQQEQERQQEARRLRQEEQQELFQMQQRQHLQQQQRRELQLQQEQECERQMQQQIQQEQQQIEEYQQRLYHTQMQQQRPQRERQMSFELQQQQQQYQPATPRQYLDRDSQPSADYSPRSPPPSPPRSQPVRERQMSMERIPRQSQRQHRNSMDQGPSSPPMSPYQQMQHVLQNQQEQILAIQSRVQRQQRAQQFVVQSGESTSALSSSPLSLVPEAESMSSSLLRSAPPSPPSSGRSSGSGYHHQNSQSHTQAQAQAQTPAAPVHTHGHHLSRRAQQSLMTRAERDRTMTDRDRRREQEAIGHGQNDEAFLRSVLNALGQNSNTSDDDNNDDDDDDDVDTDEEDAVVPSSPPVSASRRYRLATSLSFGSHAPASRRDTTTTLQQQQPQPQHSRYRSYQETGDRSGVHPSQQQTAQVDAELEDSINEDERCYREQVAYAQLQHQQRILEHQQQQQRQQRTRSWNRRLFGGLWGNNSSSNNNNNNSSSSNNNSQFSNSSEGNSNGDVQHHYQFHIPPLNLTSTSSLT
ncbi:hypothetical protein BGZ98_000718 [Dissophora globulifera]|nr:hypothetical protein BGZ98_000718 [Dissophora globulifera]